MKVHRNKRVLSGRFFALILALSVAIGSPMAGVAYAKDRAVTRESSQFLGKLSDALADVANTRTWLQMKKLIGTK